VFVTEFASSPTEVTVPINAYDLVTSVFSNSFAVEQMTNTSAILVTYMAYSSISNSGSGNAAVQYGRKIQVLLDYSVNGGTWFNFHEQDWVVPIASIDMGTPQNQIDDATHGAGVSVASSLTTGEFFDTRIYNFRVRIKSKMASSGSSLIMSNHSLTLVAGKR
jgi:hypothetical protein